MMFLIVIQFIFFFIIHQLLLGAMINTEHIQWIPKQQQKKVSAQANCNLSKYWCCWGGIFCIIFSINPHTIFLLRRPSYICGTLFSASKRYDDLWCIGQTSETQWIDRVRAYEPTHNFITLDYMTIDGIWCHFECNKFLPWDILMNRNIEWMMRMTFRLDI